MVFFVCCFLDFETAFTERHRVSAPRTSFFTLTAAGHWGWAMCVGDEIGHLRYKIRFLFDNESKKYIRNCSFYVEPDDNCTQSRYTPVKLEKPKPVDKTITQAGNGCSYFSHYTFIREIVNLKEMKLTYTLQCLKKCV